MSNIHAISELLKYTVFVIPCGRGKWDVRRWGHNRCLRRQLTKRQALDVAKRFIRNQYGVCRINIDRNTPGCIAVEPQKLRNALTENSNV